MVTINNDRRASCSIKVIRILRQLVDLLDDYRPIGEFAEVFSKDLNSFAFKPIFLDYLLLNIDNAEAHAKEFASLLTLS